MTNTIRMELIDRFRSGLMSQAEQTRFHELLASDTQLRKLLEADDLISGAIHSDLAGISTNHAVTQSRVMESLANVSGRGLSAGSMTRGGNLPWSGASGLVKAVATTIMIGGLAAGVYGLWPRSEASAPVVPPAATVAQPEIQAPQLVAPSQPDVPQVVPSVAAASDTTTTVESGSAGRAAAHSERTMPPQTRPERKSAMVKQPTAAVAPEQHVPAPVEQPATKSQPQQVKVRKIDSVRLKIEVPR